MQHAFERRLAFCVQKTRVTHLRISGKSSIRKSCAAELFHIYPEAGSPILDCITERNFDSISGILKRRAEQKTRSDASRASLVPDIFISFYVFISIFFPRFIFFVRPRGEAHWSAQTCLFPHVAAFWGVGRSQTDQSFSLSSKAQFCKIRICSSYCSSSSEEETKIQ